MKKLILFFTKLLKADIDGDHFLFRRTQNNSVSSINEGLSEINSSTSEILPTPTVTPQPNQSSKQHYQQSKLDIDSDFLPNLKDSIRNRDDDQLIERLEDLLDGKDDV